jgi:hypothetical protein
MRPPIPGTSPEANSEIPTSPHASIGNTIDDAGTDSLVGVLGQCAALAHLNLSDIISELVAILLFQSHPLTAEACFMGLSALSEFAKGKKNVGF